MGHADPNINYLTIHIWPYNWSWVKADSLAECLPIAKENTRQYIEEHLVVARKYNKPVVLEEFGFPRDGFQFRKDSPTHTRDAYYKYVFDLIKENTKSKGLFVGCNLWGWGGLATLNEESVFWKRGDDYTGDPAQEEQGLNSVFMSDTTTIQLIKASIQELNRK